MVTKSFDLGNTVMTIGIAEKLEQDMLFSKFILESFARYQSCDWGDTYKSDCIKNDSAVRSGNDRILAKYSYNEELSIFIHTEWDRSVTTIMFVSEY